MLQYYSCRLIYWHRNLTRHVILYHFTASRSVWGMPAFIEVESAGGPSIFSPRKKTLDGDDESDTILSFLPSAFGSVLNLSISEVVMVFGF